MLHPILQMHVQYEIEGPYLATLMYSMYITLPTDIDVRLCLMTRGHLCMFKQALYPVNNTNWCIYALFVNDINKIKRNCVDHIISSTEPIFFRDKTSFRQFLTWLLPGLKKMLILIISNTEGVKVLVCPAIFWTLMGNGNNNNNSNNNSNNKWVKNLSRRLLTKAQENILSHGPNYAIVTREPPIGEYVAQIERVCQSLTQGEGEELRA